MSHHLPRAGIAVFGRDQAVSEIRELIGSNRLVTLTGTGGIGKTRLAIAVAEATGPEVAERLGWVQLGSLEDDRLVAPAVCTELGIRAAPGASPTQSLVDELHSQKALLVLDNCEHLLETCAELVSTLLLRCQRLRVLTTSRAPLGLAEEAVRPVSPLPVPDPELEPDTLMPLAAEAPAVQLFMHRARSIGRDVELTRANVEPVVRLCRRLDGIPLALELAAARLNILSIEQIAERIERGLDLLRGTAREAPSRHRTMRAALAWSHELLAEPQRVLFRRLAVFGGRADIEACEWVCAGGVVERAEVLDGLGGLMEQSLVAVEDRAGVARYRLLEPVRQYAREQLDAAGEADAVRRRHAACFLDRAQREAPSLHGPERAAAVRRLETEHDNLRSAWDNAVRFGDAATLAGLARALFWFWQFGGHFHEGRLRAEEALAELQPEGEAAAVLLYTAGSLAWIQGDNAVAETRLTRCVSLCEQRGYRDQLGLGLRELAGTRLASGELDAAAELYERSGECLYQQGKQWDRALSLLMLADVRESQGNCDAAARLREEPRRVFGAMRDAWGQSLVHFSRAVAAARAGRYEQARIAVRETLAQQSSEADDWNIGQCRALLGEVELGARHAERAAGHLRDSLQSFRRAGDRTAIVYVLESLVECERRLGRTLRAVRMAGAARSHAESLEGAYPYALSSAEEREATVGALRRSVAEDAFAEQWAAGWALDLDSAVELALQDPMMPARQRPSMEEGAGAALRVFALGPPEVYRGQRCLQPSDWTFAQPRELLFYLLMHGPRTKEQIGLEFWPDASESQLRGRFRTAMYHLRRALGGTEWVIYRDGRYAFNRSLDYWFDVEAFEARLDEAAGLVDTDPAAAADAFQRGIDLYRGGLLEGESAPPWAQAYRERLQRRYFDALLTQAELNTAQGAHEAAAELCRRAVASDPLSERAYRQWARCLAAVGDRGRALRRLDELANTLHDELAAKPSNETLALRAELESGV